MPIPTELLDTITERLRPGGRPGNSADAIAVWNTLQATFRPLLGPLSMELLFVRTLSEHAHEFPWLEHCAMRGKPHDAFDAFALCLDNHAPADIVAANRVLLAAYIAQLSDLIGERLAARFLGSAFPVNGADQNI